MSTTFIYGATTCAFNRDPVMNGVWSRRQFRSPSVLSGGRKRYVYNKGIVADIVTLTWDAIDPTDLANLLTFLRAVNFSGDAFTFLTDVLYPPPGGIAWQAGVAWQSGVAWASTAVAARQAQYIAPSRLEWTPAILTERDFTIELLVKQP